MIVLLPWVIGAADAADDDPFVGKWVLDREHSIYKAGVPPEDMVITMETTDKGLHYDSETTFPNGAHAKAEYTAQYGGRLAMVTGDNRVLPLVALRRPDAKTVEAFYKREFKVVAIARRVVSDDGSIMTITTVSNDRDNKETTLNVAVFDKVD
jgi:hypothetical protein